MGVVRIDAGGVGFVGGLLGSVGGEYYFGKGGGDGERWKRDGRMGNEEEEGEEEERVG